MIYSTLKTTLFLALFFTIQIGFSQSKIDKATAEKINQQFEQQQKGNVPAAAIVVVEKGKVIYQKSFGNANLEHGIAATTVTKFQMGDICNQFVAYAVLKLQEKGKLSLDDDIRKHLPDFPNYGQTVTIRHLLMHQHGLPDYMTLQWIGGWGTATIRSHNEVIKLMKRQPELVAEPGKEFNYNSTGFVIAAEIIERVAGESFAKFAEKNIFTPLKMSNSLFYENPTLILDNKSIVYREVGEIFFLDQMYYHSLPSTNFYTTVEDLGKWMIHLQGKGAVVQQFNTESVALEGEESSFGLGQFVDDLGGVKRLHHNGLAYGNLTYMARFPKHDFGVAVVSNNSNFNSSEAALAVAELLLKEHITIETPTESPVAESAEVIYKNLNTKQLTEFAGHYWNDDYFYNRQIALKNDTLFYVRNGVERALGALDDHTFGILGRDDVRIVFGKKNGAKTMVFHFSGYEYHYEAYVPVTYTSTDLNAFAGIFFAKEIGTAYEVSTKDNQLTINNLRTTDIPFTPIKDGIFVSGTWWFSNVTFEKDNTGTVTGFRLSTSDVKGLLFEKI